jgi:penicillin-binding protein 2
MSREKFIDPFNVTSDGSNIKRSTVVGFNNNRQEGSFFFDGSRSLSSKNDNVNRQRLSLIFVVSVLMITSLFGRLVWLQLLRGEYYSDVSDNNRLRREFIAPHRGLFVDRYDKPLVDNSAVFTLYISPNTVEDGDKQKVATVVNEEMSKYQQPSVDFNEVFLSKSQLPLAVVTKIPHEAALDLMIKLQGVKGVKIALDPIRQYHYNNIFAHIFGYMGRITEETKKDYLAKRYQLTEKVGVSGLEQVMEDDLRGQPGWRSIEVDSMGREQKVADQQPAVDGNMVELTIDGELQNKIREVLEEKNKNSRGSVIMSDPNTGAILAMVSWPTFDHNALGQGAKADYYKSLLEDEDLPLYNRSISGEYPSGSTVKIVVSAGALEDGDVTKDTTFLSTGGVHYDKWFFPDWKAGGHGVTNVLKAIAESVNTFYYSIALETFNGRPGLGLNRMRFYFEQFGLGVKSGIDVPGERSGLVPSAEWKRKTKDEAWYPGDTMHLAIGQGDLLVTPLQVVDYTAVVANGGTLYKPFLVNRVFTPAGEVIKQTVPSAIRTVAVSNDNLELVRQGMRQAVTNGSARRLNSLPIEVAGKTGTAQSGVGKPNHAWFTGFFPYDKPQVVITILIEHGGEGSSIAVPIAFDVIDWYAKSRLQSN